MDALAEFNGFVEQLIEGIATFDPACAGLTVKDCTYRIYRDVRWSLDKRPYKTYMGTYIAPHGKKAGYAGYYFHVEPVPDPGAWSQGSLMTGGMYMPAPEVLKSIREEIVDNGDGVEKAIREAKGFALDETNKLKRPPKDFPVGTPYDELLKLKDLYVTKYVSSDFLLDKNLLKNTVAEFKKTYPLVQLLNRCVELVYE